MAEPNKNLGQHWLNDEAALTAICESAGLDKSDTVLEVGPGPGSLTKQLLPRAKKVVAVELDKALAKALPRADNLQVVKEDIRRFDLNSLPRGYKVVANIPYYLTSHLLRQLAESPNPPAAMTLLVQKEVAERLRAQRGQMSILAVSVQLFYECRKGQVIPAKLFTPPPKVDSQVVNLRRRETPLFADLDTKEFFKLVKAGFSERRKKMRSALAGGLRISKEQADERLKQAGIDGNLRAQELSLEDWHKIYLTG